MHALHPGWRSSSTRCSVALLCLHPALLKCWQQFSSQKLLTHGCQFTVSYLEIAHFILRCCYFYHRVSVHLGSLQPFSKSGCLNSTSLSCYILFPEVLCLFHASVNLVVPLSASVLYIEVFWLYVVTEEMKQPCEKR